MNTQEYLLDKAEKKGVGIGIKQGVEKGIEIGVKKKAVATAIELKKRHFSIEEIAAITKLSIKEIEQLS